MESADMGLSADVGWTGGQGNFGSKCYSIN